MDKLILLNKGRATELNAEEAGEFIRFRRYMNWRLKKVMLGKSVAYCYQNVEMIKNVIEDCIIKAGKKGGRWPDFRAEYGLLDD